MDLPKININGQEFSVEELLQLIERACTINKVVDFRMWMIYCGIYQKAKKIWISGEPLKNFANILLAAEVIGINTRQKEIEFYQVCASIREDCERISRKF